MPNFREGYVFHIPSNLGKDFIVGRYHSTLTRGYDFVSIERITRGCSPSTDGLEFIQCSMTLGGIVDNGDSIGFHLVHINGVTVNMNRQYRFGIFSYSSKNL